MDKLVNACETYHVPVPLALAVMEQESGFDVNALGPDGTMDIKVPPTGIADLSAAKKSKTR